MKTTIYLFLTFFILNGWAQAATDAIKFACIDNGLSTHSGIIPMINQVAKKKPVCDVFCWPGRKKAELWNNLLKEWQLTDETMTSFKGNPIDNLEPLAKAGIPIEVFRFLSYLCPTQRT